jgi:hypothetical protein
MRQRAESDEVYHERQRVLKCGVHAVNNLLGERAFEVADFERLAKELSPTSFWSLVGAGNYDVNVLECALKKRGLVCFCSFFVFRCFYFGYRKLLRWFDKRNDFSVSSIDASCRGLVLNQLADGWWASLTGMRHWSSVRRIQGVW